MCRLLNSDQSKGVFSYSRGVARRWPGSTGFSIFSSELNVNGYPFKNGNSLLDKGQLLKGKNLLLIGEGRF